MITNIVDRCRKYFVPKMIKGKKRKPSWMDNRAHKAQKGKHKSYDKQKLSYQNMEDYKKAILMTDFIRLKNVQWIFSLETWFYRIMLRISWKEKVTNVEVYRRMNTSTSFLIDIVHRQLTFLGHILRKGELENLAVTGFVDGKRDRGRQRETSQLPQQDCWKITIGADKFGEEKRCLDEVLCT